MHRIGLITVGLCGLVAGVGFGQSTASPRLSELKTPSAPAFTMLGIQPNDISRPKDLNAVELSVLSAGSATNASAFPTTFALEASPYYLGHPDVTFTQLEAPTDLFTTLYRTLSISVATAQRPDFRDSTRKVSQFGAGFRAYLAQGRLANRSLVADAVKNIADVSAAIEYVDLLINLSKDYLAHNPAVPATPGPEAYRTLLIDLLRFPFVTLKTSASPTDRNRANALATRLNAAPVVKKAYYRMLFDVAIPYINDAIMLDHDDAGIVLDDLKDRIDVTYNNNRKFLAKLEEVRQYREKRVGWLLEAAGALGIDATTAGLSSLTVGKSGAWLTLTHRPEKIQGFDFILVLRYLAENSEVRRANNYDVGSRVVYDTGKLILSVEALHRSMDRRLSQTVIGGVTYRQSQVDQSWRWGANVGYRITKNIVVNGSFAKSLASDLLYKGAFVSMLGVNFGFGQPMLTADQR